MPGFEEYVREITKGLELPEAVKEEIRQEALAHLEDEAERLVAAGKTREEAEALAVEAFGRGDAIAGLVDEALSGRQERYRRKKAIAAAAVVAGYALATVVFGAGLNTAYSYFAVGALWGGLLPGSARFGWEALVPPIGFLGAAFAAYRLSHVGKRFVAYSALGVFAVMMVTRVAARLLHWEAAYTTLQDISILELLGIFCVGLAGAGLLVVAIGAWGFILRRDRNQARLFVWCLATAALGWAWGAAGLIVVRARADGPGFLTWSNNLSVGLWFLSHMMLIWFLARAMSERRRAGEAGSEGRQAQLAS